MSEVVSLPWGGPHNPDPESHAWNVLTYKWIFTIKYRITMLQSTDLKMLSNKEGPREDA